MHDFQDQLESNNPYRLFIGGDPRHFKVYTVIPNIRQLVAYD